MILMEKPTRYCIVTLSRTITTCSALRAVSVIASKAQLEQQKQLLGI